MNTLQRFLGRVKKSTIIDRKLSTSVVTHDSIDDMELHDLQHESPRFRRMTVDEPPQVEPLVEEPPAIDFTTASREEIDEYQEKARAARAARENAPPYEPWKDLTGDVFRSYHTHDQPQVIEEVDPGVELHKRIIPRLMVTDEHAESRNITRDDPTMAALATMATVGKLREILGDELTTQAREAQEYEEQRQKAEDLEYGEGGLGDMREDAKKLKEKGEPIPQELVDQIKQAVKEQRQALGNAEQIAANPTPMSAAAAAAIGAAAEAGQQAAEAAKGLPSFGSGLGEGEPTYTSPEQAISIAERWANDPDLRAMAELFGRLDRDIRFHRSKRVIGGNDEIVDIEFGDNLSRVIPGELALLGDDDMEDDFLSRYVSGELLQFSTMGEENAGRGPILMVVDGSASMSGERNVWARATAMCLLHIARLEKRDFGLIEFSGGAETAEWLFPAKQSMDGEMVIEMASHFFSGGTAPITGVARGVEVMRDAPEFKKADLVLVGDGEASFGPEDQRLRDALTEMGVRLFGIGVGGSFTYLANYCEHVVDVHDMDLTDPSAATAELATHIT